MTKIVIKSVETIIDTFELKESFISAQHILTKKKVLYVILTDHHGQAVKSECPVFEQAGYTTETVTIAKEVIEKKIAPLILNRAISDPKQIADWFNHLTQEYPFSCASVEIGVWELVAKQKRQALSSLWQTNQSPLREGLVIGKKKTLVDYQDIIEKASKYNLNRIKLKWDPKSDPELLKKIRKAMPDTIDLAIDANQSFEASSDLIEIAKIVDFIEQPFKKNEWEKSAQLQCKIKIPICLDEAVSNLDDLQKMIKTKAGEMLNIKPTKVGGIVRAKQLHDECQKHQLRCFIGGMLESNIGRSVVRNLATWPGITEPSDVVQTSWYIKSN